MAESASVRTNPSSPTADRELVFTRLLDAPRELVFDAFTRPEHVKQWWGPNGFTNTIHEMDVRPGGRWRHVMHGPDGRDYENDIVFVEVKRPERLAFKHIPGKEPVSHETTIDFADKGGRTEVTMRLVFTTASARAKVVTDYRVDEGGRQTLERLAAFLAEASPRQ